MKLKYVCWTEYAVHKLKTPVHHSAVGSETVCGHKVPSPIKVGPVGYYDQYDETKRGFCKNCEKKGKSK